MNLDLSAIWTEFATRLREFIRRRVANESAVEDLLQDVFVKIHQRLSSLRRQEKLEAWLFQITRNIITDYYRSRRPTEALPEDLAAEDSDAPPPDRMQLLQAFQQMIAALPEPYAEAIRLTEYVGLTQAQLAQKLGISLSGAKSRVQRGRAMLKQSLLDCGQLEFDVRGAVIRCKPRKEDCCEACDPRLTSFA